MNSFAAVGEILEARVLLAPVVMSEQEQLLIELVNRARANPVAEAARFGIDLNSELEPDEISPDPKQPLAPHQSLVDAARGHALDMLDREFFEHVNPDGKGPSDRARAAGYPAGAGENIAWFGTPEFLERSAEVYRRHEALFLSPPHRTNMMNAGYREIGNAVEYGVYEVLNSIMVAENFGNRGGDNFITGVVYTDRVEPDNFFTIGEAIGSANIMATRNRDGAQFKTTSGAAGGFGLQVPTGVYTLSATSRRIEGVMVVSDVVVLGRNAKVDFNTRNPRVGSIAGVVFEDSDRDGQRDAGERAITGRSVYLDANDDGEQSPDESVSRTGSDGRYLFSNLRPGTYQVRQVLELGWDNTMSGAGTRRIELGPGQQRNGVSFGTFQFNRPPIAEDDFAATESGLPISIDVFANDHDADGELVADQTQILVSPQHGEVGLNSATGQLVYRPDAGFSGTDRFEYAATDDLGLVSNRAVVEVMVTPEVGEQWRNPTNGLDVNNDTFVSSIDALLILNSISTDGTRRLPFPSSDRSPPPYLDANGDAFVSPFDALLVLNEINRIAAERNRRAEGEPADFTTSDDSSSVAVVRAARGIHETVTRGPATVLIAAAVDTLFDDARERAGLAERSVG